MTRPLLLATMLAGLACAREAPLVRLEFNRTSGGSHLRLVGAPGARINARLKPALELDDGTVLRFDSPHLTADSAYFAAPPSVEVPKKQVPRRGLLRASVCPAGETVCRTVELVVRF